MYLVKTPLRFNRVRHEAGAVLDLAADLARAQIDQLLAVKAVELIPDNRDLGDEQPPGPQREIQPGADSAEGLNPASEGAGSPAPSAATDSAPDAQHEQQAGEQSPPSGEAADAQIAEGIAQPESAPKQGPEPATDVSPAKADKPRARKGAK